MLEKLHGLLKKHKIPAIINTSWGGLEAPQKYPDHILFVKKIPYDWILPKIFAVVHHGGTGTTHSALKYACPSLIIPHIVDQFYWNKRIAKLGLGPKGNPIKELNEIDFERQLLDLMNNENYKLNAEIFAKKMAEEANDELLFEKIAE